MSRINIHRRAFLCLLLALTLAAHSAISAEPEKSLHVSGCIPNASDWTTARLKQQFAAELKQIYYTSKG